MARVSPGGATSKCRSWRALIALGLCSGCLVTNKVDYDPQIIPSQVILPITPAQEFVRVLPTEVVDPICGNSSQMRFEATIRDLNVEEELTARFIVNGDWVGTQELRANGEEVRERQPGRCVERSLLQAPCNLVEIIVSSEFADDDQDDFYTPRSPNDIASVHWWVIGAAESTPNASFLDCNDLLPDGGVP